MKLVGFELHKLFSSRGAVIFLLILLSCNLVLVYFSALPLPTEKAAREVYGQYLRDPETVISYMEQLEADFFEHIRDDEFELPSTFIEGADDMAVLRRVLDRAEYLRNFRAETEKLADSASRRADDLRYFGYAEDSYYVAEQHSLARVYSDLSDVLDGEDEYAYGYDIYYEDTRVCLFILVWLIFSVSFIFRGDRANRFESVMRTAKLGRLGTASAKLAAALSVSTLSALLFLVTSFIAVGLANGGFSSAAAPIQLLPGYARVPLEVSMLGYLLLQTVYRLLAAAVFALFMSLAASLGLGYLPCFGAGALFAAANYFIFAHKYLGSVPPVKYLNLASAAEGIALFAFHRDLNLFGRPTPITVILIPIMILSSAVLAVVCAFFWCRNFRITLPKLPMPNIVARRKKRRAAWLRLCPALPIWVYELMKNRVLPLALTVIILLSARVYYVSYAIGDGETRGEAIYYGYIAEIREMTSDERCSFLASERAELESIISDHGSMTEAYGRGELSADEYNAYLRDHYAAKDREKILSDVEEYSKYISRRSAALGFECPAIYNTGYERFFALGEDWFLFAAIVILSAGSFSVEYRHGNCAQIIRSTKKGRRMTFFSKIIPYSAIGALLGVLFRAAGLAVAANNYGLSDFDAALCSILAFGEAESAITVRTYLAIDLAVSMLAGTLIACAVCALSCLFKKTLHCLGAVGAVLALPALLSSRGDALLGLTAPNRLFGQALSATIIFHVFAVMVLTLIAMRGFAGGSSLRKKENNDGQ